MKILITGVAGFLGSNLAQFLIDKKYEVWGVDNFITGTEENLNSLPKSSNFNFFKGNIVGFDFSSFPTGWWEGILPLR